MATPEKDLAKSAEQLVSEMHELIGGSPTNPAFNTLTAMRGLHKFACIFVVLGRQADAQTKRIVRLTWALLIFTAVLLVLTLAIAIRG
jgi:hypothetical protein